MDTGTNSGKGLASRIFKREGSPSNSGKACIAPNCFSGNSYAQTRLDELQRLLKKLDGFFHVDVAGGGHKHRVPEKGELLAMQQIRDSLVPIMQELAQSDPAKMQEIVKSSCCTPTIKYVTSGEL